MCSCLRLGTVAGLVTGLPFWDGWLFYFLGRWRLGRDAVGARGCWDGWLREGVLNWGVLTVP